MSGVLEAILVALSTIFSWPTVLFLLLGIAIGLMFGVIPGLGGTVALVLLLPFTFPLQPAQAMVLLASVLGAVAFSGSITAILVNIPGTPPNAATCFDGHPLTKQGRANEALGISATASAFGAVVGLFVIILLVPVARMMVFAFSPPEFFWLAIGGLLVVAVVSRGNMYRSLVAGGFGLLLGFVGYSGQFGAARYTFDVNYLWGGIQVIPLLIGLFAVTEVIRLAQGGGTIASTTPTENSSSSWKDGVRQVLKHPMLFARSAVIGTVVGMIPGAGGVIANFMAYAQAVQTSGNPDSFGEGNPKGVIASEAANNAKDAGSILPTVVLGIPGSVAMVVMLSGFLLHGVTPGRQLLNQDLNILFVIVLSLLVSNLLVAAIGIAGSRYLVEITRIPVDTFIPVILVFSLTGAYIVDHSFGSVVLAVLFGIVGYAAVAFDYSRIAIILGIILGPIAETAYHQSLAISNNGALIFVTRPLSALLALIVTLALVVPLVRDRSGTPEPSVEGPRE